MTGSRKRSRLADMPKKALHENGTADGHDHRGASLAGTHALGTHSGAERVSACPCWRVCAFASLSVVQGKATLTLDLSCWQLYCSCVLPQQRLHRMAAQCRMMYSSEAPCCSASSSPRSMAWRSAWIVASAWCAQALGVLLQSLADKEDREQDYEPLLTPSAMAVDMRCCVFMPRR